MSDSQHASLRDLTDFEATNSVTGKEGLTKQEGYFYFCERKQRQRKGRMQDGPQQYSSFPALFKQGKVT